MSLDVFSIIFTESALKFIDLICHKISERSILLLHPSRKIPVKANNKDTKLTCD